MKLAVNGKEQELRDETTLGELFEQLKLSYPKDKLTKKAAKKLVR